MSVFTSNSSMKVVHLYQNFVRQERSNFILWMPVFQAAGIIWYFSLENEPETYFLLINFIILTLIGGAFLVIKFKALIMLFMVMLGFIAPEFKNFKISHRMIKSEFSVRGMTAIVEEITPDHKLLLDPIKISYYTPQHTDIPAGKIRLTVRTKMPPELFVGDRVKISAVLYPPPSSPTKDAYDFAKYAYFKGISAVGFATSAIHIEQHNKGHHIAKMRNAIYKTLQENLGGIYAEIIAALLIGKREGIPPHIMDNVRDAGIAHVFAISGLHLVFVSGMFFFLLRRALSCSQYLTLKYNIKKFAAIFAMLASGIYLLMAGAPISAQRAFIMVSALFIAIIIDRRYHSMRALATAASLIFLLTPEAIMTPSFQMSFAAVLALISYSRSVDLSRSFGILSYFFAVLCTSIIATLATAPYTIYHFNSFSLGGLLTNFIAIPVVTFIIIPLGISYVLLAGLSIGIIPKYILQISIDSLLWVVDKVSALPYSVVHIPSISSTMLIIISIGLLWLCICSSRWKYCGIAIATSTTLLIPFYHRPDILVTVDQIAFRDYDNKLYSLTKRNKNFIAMSWAKQNGQKQLLQHEDKRESLVTCNNSVCKYHNKGFTLLFASTPFDITSSCSVTDLIIQYKKFIYPECQTAAIKYEQLNALGVYTITLHDHKMTIKHLRSKRPWHA